MITVIYNEKQLKIENNSFLSKLLETMGITSPKGIAVALNYAVVPRDEWAIISLKDGDRIDLLQAIQGG